MFIGVKLEWERNRLDDILQGAEKARTGEG